jgi:hypothetical protein
MNRFQTVLNFKLRRSIQVSSSDPSTDWECIPQELADAAIAALNGRASRCIMFQLPY